MDQYTAELRLRLEVAEQRLGTLETLALLNTVPNAAERPQGAQGPQRPDGAELLKQGEMSDADDAGELSRLAEAGPKRPRGQRAAVR